MFGRTREIYNSLWKEKNDIAKKMITVLFHNGSKYDYYFIIKRLANAFQGKLELLGKNTEKYKTFSISIEK